MEADLTATEGRAEAVNRRLYGGTVTAARELQALAADVESLKARASVLEDQVLELMESREPLEAELAGLSARLEALDARRQTAAAALCDRRSRRGRGPGPAGEPPGRRPLARCPPTCRPSTIGCGPASVGVAVARLVGNHCDGCHLTLSAMELDRIRHLPAGEVVTCEQCGRILVHE